MRPDVDVLGELTDHLRTELLGPDPGALGILCGRAADIDVEPDVGGGFVDRGDARDGAVVDHPPALGHRDAQPAVDGLHPAVDVLDPLAVVALERDGEVDVGHRRIEVVPGEDRVDRDAVDVPEMLDVHPVLQHVLRMHLQTGPVEPLLRVVVIEAAGVVETGEHIGSLEERIPAEFVVPDVYRRIAFGDGIGLDAAAAVGSILVGDAHVSPFVAPLPAVERALQNLAGDDAAETQVRPEVFAIGVHHRQLPGLGTPGDHLLTEVLHGVYPADGDLVGPRDLEPPRGLHRQWRLGHARKNHRWFYESQQWAATIDG